MSNMRIPTRRAPTVEDARRIQNNNAQNRKKVPPPRPPPPNFTLTKSKSAWTVFPQNENTISLIDWSPPNSPKPNRPSMFNGSVSSSFSSSTSSLASSKKSYESEGNEWMLQPPVAPVANSTFYQTLTPNENSNGTQAKIGPGPTIIRAAPPKKKALRPTASASTSREVSPLPPYFQTGILTPTSVSVGSSLTSSPEKDDDDGLPMPNIPPPSPPKDVDTGHVEPFGIALYDYAGQDGDLSFSVNEVIYLIKQINTDWLMGRTVDDREGIFPATFVDIQVPLPRNGTTLVTALYDFETNVPGDLRLKTGDKVRIHRIVDTNWLEGECNGRRGQFPASFVDSIPNI